MIHSTVSLMASPLMLAAGGVPASQTYRTSVQKIRTLTDNQESVSLSELLPPTRSLVTGLKEMKVLAEKIEMASKIAGEMEKDFLKDPQADVASALIIDEFQREGLLPLEDEDIDAAATRLRKLGDDVATHPQQVAAFVTTLSPSDGSVQGGPSASPRASRGRPAVVTAPTAPSRAVPIKEAGKTLVVQKTYELRRELGRGGMGVVYKAWDTQIERFVAVKMVDIPDSARADGARTEFIKEFGREAKLQVETPRIVRVYDSGITKEGNPFIIMEMMERSLWDYLGLIEKGDLRFDLDDITTKAQHAVEAVVETHKMGIVHQDIKPANFLISYKGIVKLGDFGIAETVGGTDTRDSEDKKVPGTPPYMSLEALAGAPPAFSRDVYALGTMLYEMLTGQIPFPFPYDATKENLRKHAANKLQDPRPPSEMAPDRNIPPELDKIVLKALGFSPEDRYGDAKALLTSLSYYNAGALDRKASKVAQQTLSSLVPVSERDEAQVHFIGREQELKTLRQAVGASIAEKQARAVVLSGEAGQGKSLLATKLIEILKQDVDGLSILKAQGKLEAKSPGAAIAGVIRKQVGIEANDKLASQRSKLEHFVQSTCSGTEAEQILQRDLLGELLGLEFEEMSDQLKYLRQDPAKLRMQILEAVVTLFDHLSQQGPVVLVLEDLHWIDIGTLHYTKTLLARLKDRPFFVLGLTRPEFFEKTVTFPVERMDLEGLSDELLSQLVDKILGDRSKDRITEVNRKGDDIMALDPDAPRVREFLVRQSDGTPFMVQEYAQMVKDGWQIDGWLIEVRADQQWDFVRDVEDETTGARERKSVPIDPNNPESFLKARLDTYAAKQRELLEWAAVIGTSFSAEDLECLFLSNANPLLNELVQRKALIRLKNERYKFPHALLRDAVYSKLKASARREHHHRRARDLVSKGSDTAGMKADELTALIAYHYEEAQDSDNDAHQPIREQAAIYFMKAGQGAYDRGAHITAVNFFERVTQLSKQAKKQVEALLGWEKTLFSDRKYERQLEVMAMAHKLIQSARLERSLKATVYHKYGRAYRINKNADAAEQQHRSGLALYTQSENTILKSKLLMGLGVNETQNRKDFAKGHEYYLKAVQVARATNDKEVQITALNNLVYIGLHNGEYSLAITSGKEALAIYDEEDITLLREKIRLDNNIGSAYMGIGDYEEAASIFKKAIDASRKRAGGDKLEFLLANYARAVSLMRGEKALKRLDDAVAVHCERPDEFIAGIAHLYIALECIKRRELPRAEAEAKESLRVALLNKDKQLEAMAQMALAQVYQGQGKLDEALNKSEGAYAILGSKQFNWKLEEFDLEILLTHGRILQDGGRPAEASSVIKRARDILHERADKISDPKQRESFLGQVKVNQTIEQLWHTVRRESVQQTVSRIISGLHFVVPKALPEDLLFPKKLKLGELSPAMKVGDSYVSATIISAPTSMVLEKLLTQDVEIERNEGPIPQVWAKQIKWHPSFDEEGNPLAEIEFTITAAEENVWGIDLLEQLIEWSSHYVVKLRGEIRQGKAGEIRVDLTIPHGLGRLENKHFGNMTFILAPRFDGKTIVALRMQDRPFTKNPSIFLQGVVEMLKKTLTLLTT